MSGNVSRQEAANEAARMLEGAERGYARKYGAVPLPQRIEIGAAWISLVAALGPGAVSNGSADARGHADLDVE